MPTLSKTSVPAEPQGPATQWAADLGGYTTNLVTIHEDSDLTELLKGLPGDCCPSPHWGYVFSGRLWWRHGDREENVETGQAFYVEPGHTAGADAGTEFVIFSPAEVMSKVEAHIAERAAALYGAPPG